MPLNATRAAVEEGIVQVTALVNVQKVVDALEGDLATGAKTYSLKKPLRRIAEWVLSNFASCSFEIGRKSELMLPLQMN